LGVSHFVTKQVQLEVAGYYFQQITDDFGAPAALGGVRSRVTSIGPQVCFLFPMGDFQGYLNIKGYKNSRHRTGRKLQYLADLRHLTKGAVQTPASPRIRK
jgi:hypothetical protein